MHEALFDDRFLKDTGVTTLDFAKALIDEGFHPMTMYFPLVVHGALLIEPTETESKATLDRFIDSPARLGAAGQGGRAAEAFHAAPHHDAAPPPRRDRRRPPTSAALEAGAGEARAAGNPGGGVGITPTPALPPLRGRVASGASGWGELITRDWPRIGVRKKTSRRLANVSRETLKVNRPISTI